METTFFERNKNILSIIFVIILVGVIGVIGYQFTRNTQDPAVVDTTPREITVSGTYICLPHRDTSGFVTMECAFGLQTAASLYYALDTSLLADDFFTINTGDTITITGTFVPLAALSTDRWQSYPIEGIIQVKTLDALNRTVVFACRDSKSITATFHLKNTDSVDLRLSDGRNFTGVERAISASGARYVTADQQFVFWNKGSEAFILEGTGERQTFFDCMAEGFALKD